MIDRLFLATLTLSVLLVGSLTIASAVFNGALHAPVPVVQLERVVITAKRPAPSAVAAAERFEPTTQRAE